jgi:hypothetical protein
MLTKSFIGIHNTQLTTKKLTKKFSVLTMAESEGALITKRDFINSKLANFKAWVEGDAEASKLLQLSGLQWPVLPLNDDDYLAFATSVTTLLVPQQRTLATKLAVVKASEYTFRLRDLFELPSLVEATLPEDLRRIWQHTDVSRPLAARLLAYACCFVDVLHTN